MREGFTPKMDETKFFIYEKIEAWRQGYSHGVTYRMQTVHLPKTVYLPFSTVKLSYHCLHTRIWHCWRWSTKNKSRQKSRDRQFSSWFEERALAVSLIIKYSVLAVINLSCLYYRASRKKVERCSHVFATQLHFYEILLHGRERSHVQFLLLWNVFGMAASTQLLKVWRNLVLSHTFFKVSRPIPHTSTTILLSGFFVESMGVEYIFDLRCNQKKKSHGGRSWKNDVQETSIPLPI